MIDLVHVYTLVFLFTMLAILNYYEHYSDSIRPYTDDISMQLLLAKVSLFLVFIHNFPTYKPSVTINKVHSIDIDYTSLNEN